MALLVGSAMALLIAAALVGVVIGIFSGLLGIGGGMVMVPVFRLVFGMSPIASTATSLFAIIPTSISGGIQRIRNHTCVVKLGIAMALAQQTDILFLDEPTTYLDITYQVEILDLLTELNRRRSTTIVMVLHDLNLSARYADYLFAVKNGSLAAQGTPAEVITEELIKNIFNLDCQVIHDPISGSPMVVPIGRYHSGKQAGR